MWHRHNGKISVAMYRINIDPVVATAHSAPYRSRPKISNTLEQEVIEFATTKSAAPMVFAPMIDSTLRFCVH